MEESQSRLSDYGEDYSPGRYIGHPLIKKETILYRKFQAELAEKAGFLNLIVVLPTGLGKTVIAAIAAADALMRQPEKKVLFLAPTKPLATQHHESFMKFLAINEEKMGLFLGTVPARKRKTQWGALSIIFSTPQTVHNDLIRDNYTLDDVSLVVFDECHRAVGNYSYVYIASMHNGRVLGLTASPGGNREKIDEIKKNLKIDAIELRTESDADVKQHIMGTRVEWRKIALHEDMLEIRKPLSKLLLERVQMLKKVGFLSYKYATYVSKKDILMCRGRIMERMKKTRNKFYLFSALLNQFMALQAYHLLELLETQGIDPMLSYMKKFESGELSKNQNVFRKNPFVREAIMLANSSKRISHPKISELKRIIEAQMEQKNGSKAIVFTQFRTTIDTISDHLSVIPGVRCEKFVGQASKEGDRGLNQAEQKRIIGDFKAGKTNVLIATSVAEEGIDIPDVDLVVFYEPIPSEIRTIQRRGRTGRTSCGKVIVLIAEKTRDEAYLAAEIKREQKMKSIVKGMERQSNKH